MTERYCLINYYLLNIFNYFTLTLRRNWLEKNGENQCNNKVHFILIVYNECDLSLISSIHLSVELSLISCKTSAFEFYLGKADTKGIQKAVHSFNKTIS